MHNLKIEIHIFLVKSEQCHVERETDLKKKNFECETNLQSILMIAHVLLLL